MNQKHNDRKSNKDSYFIDGKNTFHKEASTKICKDKRIEMEGKINVRL